MADSASAAAPVAGTTHTPTAPVTDTAAPVEAYVTEVDDGFSENDSSYGDEQSAYTASLTSSIKNHTYENGRRYHSYQTNSNTTGYLAPNDESENDRMDMMHHLGILMDQGRLVTAPLEKSPQRILDLGTGTGIWAIEAGDEYPSATVIGVDISPTQPTMVPPNVKFEIDDVEAEWTYNEDFDYIHSRFMAGSIGDWPKYIDQAYKHVKPGGWVEFKDWDLTLRSPDNSLPHDHPVNKFHDLLFKAINLVGRTHTPGLSLKQWITDAGFEKVEETVVAAPLGLWAKNKKYKEIGAWNLLCLAEGLENISLRLFDKVLGWPIDEIMVFLSTVRGALKDKGVHYQYTYHVVTGRKPGGNAKTEEPEVEAEPQETTTTTTATATT